MGGRHAWWLAAAVAWTAGCGPGGEEGEPAFPSRDWSGPYALEVVDSSTDCTEAESPPPLEDVVVDVRQSPENDAVLQVGPLIAMGGGFDGDVVKARGSIVQPISLPDSLLGRATADDSLETIGYAMELTFAEDRTLTGRYVVRAPDLNALSSGTGAGRCEYVYEVRGRPLIGTAPREESGAAARP
jgi:hypothetical protein